MSETATKRIALTTLSAPAKKENKEKDKQHESSKAASGRQPELKTHRFVLTLPDSTEESCPEFNFADLLSSVSVSALPFSFTTWTPVRHCKQTVSLVSLCAFSHWLISRSQHQIIS
jgi:hypothetical protein